MAWSLILWSAAGVAAPWLIYPGVIWLLARLVPSRRHKGGSPAATVTCILATRDPPDTIRSRVLDFRATSYDPGLISAVVGLDWTVRSSLEEVREAVGALAAVVAAAAPGGKATALNAAVAAATGEVLVFSDAGQRFEPETIPALVSALEDRRFGAVSGRLELPGTAASPLIRAYWRLERGLRRDEARLHSSVGVTGSVYAMRRELWEPLPGGLLLDDLYLPLRLAMRGRRVGWCDAARARESRRLDDADEFRRKVRTLTGNFQVIAWLPGVLVPWRNPILAQLVFHKLLRLLTPIWLALGVVGLGWLAIARLGVVRSALYIGVPGLLVTAASGLLSPRLRRALSTGIRMQLAILRALWLGLRGDWEVWTR